MNTCNNCKKTLNGHFAISRVAAGGAMSSEAKLCSLACLVQWGYTTAVQRGLMGVTMARFALGNLIDTLRGPRG